MRTRTRLIVAILALLVSLMLPLAGFAGDAESSSPPATASGLSAMGLLRPFAPCYPLLGSEPILW